MDCTKRKRDTDIEQEGINILRYAVEPQISSWLQMDSPQRTTHLRARRPTPEATNRHVKGEKGGQLLSKQSRQE